MSNNYDWVKPAKLAGRLWSKVGRRGPDECWPFLGSRRRSGYGILWVGAKGRGQMVTASRVALAVKLGRWPEQALHTCDNPPCCNPGHLYEGDHDQNMADKKARGRVNFGNARQVLKSKSLSQEKLWEIICRYGDGERQSAIADSLGVSRALVNLIVKGKIWQREVAALFCMG